MKKINKLKILKALTIISFLAITPYSEGSAISFPIFIWIIGGLTFGIIQYFWSLFNENNINHLEQIKIIFYAILILISMFFIVKRKTILTFIGIIFQYCVIIITFNNISLNSLWFTIPTTVYLILSIILIYNLFSKKQIIK